MLLRSICSPYLVLKLPSLLTLGVLEGACWIKAGVELAHCLYMSEFAVRSRAVGPIPAKWHGWVSERATSVRAIWKEFAILLCLEDDLFGR